MSGAGVLDVIGVEVLLHRNAPVPKCLMILGPGQRREAEEFDDVERQLLLYDRNVASDAVGRIRWKAKNIPGERYDALCFPGKQHLAIFRDLVLTFLGHRKIVGIDVLQSDEHPSYACSFRLRDEARDFVAKRVDLDHQTNGDAINLAKLDEAIEDRLPVPVT